MVWNLGLSSQGPNILALRSLIFEPGDPIAPLEMPTQGFP